MAGRSLTADQVKQIAKKIRKQETYSTIAAEFGVSIGTISHIGSGLTWSEVTGFEKKAKTAAPAAVAAAAPKRGRPAKTSMSEVDKLKQQLAAAQARAKGTVAKRKPGRPAKAAASVAVAPKKRGRPPKVVAEAAPPKKRGRPPKVAAPVAAAPKKRGRPPKVVTEAAPKKRGRPAKAAASVAAAPKKRGRPAGTTTTRPATVGSRQLESLLIGMIASGAFKVDYEQIPERVLEKMVAKQNEKDQASAAKTAAKASGKAAKAAAPATGKKRGRPSKADLAARAAAAGETPAETPPADPTAGMPPKSITRKKPGAPSALATLAQEVKANETA